MVSSHLFELVHGPHSHEELRTRAAPALEGTPEARTGTRAVRAKAVRKRSRVVKGARGGVAPPLPANLDAERSVLGAILLDNHALNAATETLRPEDFFLDQHRRLFSHMTQLGKNRQAIDLVTLTDELHRRGELEASGGAPYLASLADGMPRVSNIQHYARIVKEKATLRNLIRTTHDIQQRAFEGGDSADAILADAADAVSALRARRTGDGWRGMFHTFEEFETAAPLSFAIRGFLQNNGATMIGGLSGHGKTLINLSVARALLAGKGQRLWNLFDVEESALRVVYLIPECAIEPFKHRLRLFRLYEYLAPGDERLLVRTLSKGPTPCLSDPRILFACKGAHVILDTAVRFSEGEENSSGDNQRGLASDIFALLGAGARSVLAAHHSPKPFAKETVMRLENVLRGSGDIGAMLTTAWGIKQLDDAQNIIHVENIKPRDFQPCGPFQIVGRPFIDQAGDFKLLKPPGECGNLSEEAEPRGGAPEESRKERERRVEMAREWLGEDESLSVEELRGRFKVAGVLVSRSAAKNYRREALSEP